MSDDHDWKVLGYLDRTGWAGAKATSVIADAVDLPVEAVAASLDRLAAAGAVRRVRAGDEFWIPTPRTPGCRAGAVARTPDCGRTVLLADDDESALLTYSQFLRLEGFRVVTAADVATALQLAESERPDAILIDLKLPDVEDGLGLLKQLRVRGNTTPIAVVTGHYGLDDETDAEIHRHQVRIAYKPLWFENMLVLVRDLIAHSDDAHSGE